MRVSLMLVMVLVPILLVRESTCQAQEAWVRNVIRNLQTVENGFYGCWKDDTGDRLLSHTIGRGVKNIQHCAVRCMEYVYFGMEDKDQCFCGNRINLSGSVERLSAINCYRQCWRTDYNNYLWICGAGNRISVYITETHFTYMEQFPEDPLWKTLHARRHLQTTENGYFGCWRDDTDNRLLSHEFGREVRNIQDCAVQCIEYVYFGMEDEDQCFCANQLNMSNTRKRQSNADCDRLCRYPGYNNTHWICGAPYRISVYTTEIHLAYLEQFTNDSLVQTYLDNVQMHDD